MSDTVAGKEFKTEEKLVGPPTDLNRTENKSFSNNCGKNNGDMGDGVSNEKFRTEKKLGTKDLECPE